MDSCKVLIHICNTFIDLNECNGTTPCRDNSTCRNTEPGYQCLCPAGREYDYQNNVCQGKMNQ
jgi:hypothetical protein